MNLCCKIRCALLVGALFIVACSHTPTADELTGHWRLSDVANRSPQDIGFKRFEMTFEANGKWSYTSEMVDHDKLGLGGSGEWKLDGNKLRCKSEGRDATILVSMRGGNLILEADPVIEPWNGSRHVPVITTYTRMP